MVGITMIDFRKEIRRELKRLGWSAYRLAKTAGLPLRGVQAYVAGEKDTTSARLSKLLGVLGFELKRPRKRGR